MLNHSGENGQVPIILAPEPESPETETYRSSFAALMNVGIPVIFVNLSLTFMQVTDAWMVGQLGSEELAAITPPGLLIFTLQSFACGLLAAVTTFVSQAQGRGRAPYCGHLAWQGIYAGLAFSLSCLLLWPVAPQLFGLFHNASAHVEQLQVQYFQVCVFSLFPALITLAVSNFFIGIQRNRIVIVSSLVALATNVFLNAGLMFGMFGLPELGFAGAAYGTVGASIVECLMVVAVFLSRRFAVEFGTRQWAPKFSTQGMLLKVGLPAAVQSSVDAASWGILLTWLVAFYGTAHQAASTVLVRCMQISFLPAEGIAIAIVTLVGSAAGAGKPAGAERATRLGFWMIAAYMSLMGGLMYAYRYDVMGAFTEDSEVIAIGASAMIFVALLQFFDAMNISYAHALQGAGDTLWPSIVNVVAVGVFLAGGGWFMVQYAPELGSPAIWALMALYVLVVGVSFRQRWRSGRWKQINLLEDELPELQEIPLDDVALTDAPVSIRLS